MPKKLNLPMTLNDTYFEPKIVRMRKGVVRVGRLSAECAKGLGCPTCRFITMNRRKRSVGAFDSVGDVLIEMTAASYDIQWFG
jgi:hypothetical protein